VIGTDGYPIISYFDNGNGDLKVAACHDTACSTEPATLVTLDSTGRVGLFTSIDLSADGNPVISYHDADNSDLKVAACHDATCTTAPDVNALDTTGSTGVQTSMAVGIDGNPVIAYHDSSRSALKVAACGNPTCHLYPIG